MVEDIYSLEGEIGWTYRTSLGQDHPGGHGIHLGILNHLAPAEEIAIRTTISWFGPQIVPEAILGVGGRYPNPIGIPSQCAIGRPLRVDGDLVLPDAIAGEKTLVPAEGHVAVGVALLTDTVVTAGREGTLRLWSTAGESIATLTIPEPVGIGRDAAGATLFTSGPDGMLRAFGCK